MTYENESDLGVEATKDRNEHGSLVMDEKVSTSEKS